MWLSVIRTSIQLLIIIYLFAVIVLVNVPMGVKMPLNVLGVAIEGLRAYSSGGPLVSTVVLLELYLIRRI